MKAKWIALKMRNLIPWMIASFMVLANYGCEDLLNEPEVDLPEECLFGDIYSESFNVFPGGTVIHTLDGIVTLEFPKGAVTVPTKFTLSSSFLDPNAVYGYNLMNATISLEPEVAMKSREFEIPVKITMNYDVSKFMGSLKSPEDNLTIYKLNDIHYAYSIGDCCVDCDCKTVEGCIDQCGIFVVGEN